MPMNRELVGKSYDSGTYKVTSEATIRYAKATNEDNAWFLDESREGGIVAPPIFGVVFSGPAMAPVVFDEALGADILRLVHGEQDMEFLDLVRPGDEITSEASIESITDKGSGELLVIRVDSKRQDGTPVLRARSGLFIRAKGGAKKDAKGAPAEEPPRGELIIEQSMTVDEDQTYRYAEASGDNNPIHVDDATAKMAGHPGIILHGLCTMAFTGKMIMDTVLGSDPRRLKRLAVRFSRPVLPKDRITLRGWRGPADAGSDTTLLEGKVDRDDLVVLKNGRAWVA